MAREMEEEIEAAAQKGGVTHDPGIQTIQEISGPLMVVDAGRGRHL